MRIVRALSAGARAMAWRIHQVAWVGSRIPCGSRNFSAARTQSQVPPMNEIEEGQALVAELAPAIETTRRSWTRPFSAWRRGRRARCASRDRPPFRGGQQTNLADVARGRAAGSRSSCRASGRAPVSGAGGLFCRCRRASRPRPLSGPGPCPRRARSPTSRGARRGPRRQTRRGRPPDHGREAMSPKVSTPSCCPRFMRFFNFLKLLKLCYQHAVPTRFPGASWFSPHPGDEMPSRTKVAPDDEKADRRPGPRSKHEHL